MGIEQEFKFTLNMAEYEKFQNGMERHFIGDKTYWNVYYDTTDNDLLKQECILRVTMQEDNWGTEFSYPKVTFKGPSTLEIESGLVSREEIDHYLPEGQTKMSFFRDYGVLHSTEQGGEAFDRAYDEMRRLGLPDYYKLLFPIGAMKIDRQMFFHEAVFIELDVVSFSRDSRFYELEVETLAPDLALGIIHGIADSIGIQLTPSESSKHERLREFLKNNKQKIFEWE